MSDRAEFYRRFPLKPNHMDMREPDWVFDIRPNADNYVSSWLFSKTPDYRMWRLLLPGNGVLPVYFIWFDDWGNFVQACGMGYVFYDMYCFFEHIGRGEHESEVCGRPVRQRDLAS